MKDRIMGFWRQDDRYSCGVHCFGNVLTLLGNPLSFKEAKNICGGISHLESIKMNLNLENIKKNGIIETIKHCYVDAGTETDSLVRGLKKLAYKTDTFYDDDKDAFKEFLSSETKNGNPVILSVDDNGHWITSIGKYKKNHIIIDSMYKDVFLSYSTKDLLLRCADFQENFFGISIKNKGNSILPSLDYWLPYIVEDNFLRENWGHYLSMLTDRYEAVKVKNTNGFFKDLLTMVYKFKNCDLNIVHQILSNFEVIARSYQLEIPEEKQKAAVFDLALEMGSA